MILLSMIVPYTLNLTALSLLTESRAALGLQPKTETEFCCCCSLQYSTEQPLRGQHGRVSLEYGHLPIEKNPSRHSIFEERVLLNRNLGI